MKSETVSPETTEVGNAGLSLDDTFDNELQGKTRKRVSTVNQFEHQIVLSISTATYNDFENLYPQPQLDNKF